jgi:hypothetical protein
MINFQYIILFTHMLYYHLFFSNILSHNRNIIENVALQDNDAFESTDKRSFFKLTPFHALNFKHLKPIWLTH